MPSALALLPLDISARDAQALPYWTEAERVAMAASIRSSLDAWGDAFLPPAAQARTGRSFSSTDRSEPLQLLTDRQADLPRGTHWHSLGECVGGGEGAAGAWWALGSSENPHDLVRGEAQAIQRLKSLLFGGRVKAGLSDDGIADTVASKAWETLCESLRGGLHLKGNRSGEAESLPSAILRAWSGALLLTFEWCGQTLYLVVSQACAAASRERHPRAAASRVKPTPLVPVLTAAASLPVTLRMELEPMNIGLGALMSLGVGDVLRTSHPLDDAILVKGIDPSGDLSAERGLDQDLFRCHLGKVGSNWAVELASSS